MARGFFSRLLRQRSSQSRLTRGARRSRRTATWGTDLRLEQLEDRRMLAAGDLDTTFNPSGTLPPGTLLPVGQQGVVISHFGGATAEVEAFSTVQLGTGKLLVAGRYQTTGSALTRSFMVARYNANGTLDTTFGASDLDGINGVAIVDVIAGQEDFAFDLAVDSQNRILAVGRAGNGLDVAVIRLLSEGALDTSFSGDGMVVTSSGATAEWNPNALAIDENDSIVVAGYTNPTVGDDDFLVMRYTDAGVLDASFDGDGIVTFGFNPTKDDMAFDVAIQGDGKIVVGGTGQIVASAVRDFALARLNTNGSLDATFGTDFTGDLIPDGKVMTATTIASDNIEAIAIESSGKIVVAGQASGTGGGFSIIARYDASGLLDTSTFNSGGIAPGTLRINVDNLTATTESSLGLAIQQDGKYVVAGRFVTGSDNRLLIARATPAGLLDTTFGPPGSPDGVITNLYSGSINERFADVIVQSDGKIVATGQANNNDLVLVRYESGQVIQSIAGATDVDEGSPYTLTLSATDPTITSWTIDWGDSVEIVAGNPTSVTHTYADGDAVYTISASVTNSLGTTPIANTVNVVVHNVEPTLVISGALSLSEGSTYTLNLSSSDPGTDTITSWTIDWGDSVEIVAGNPTSATHTFADGANTYAVSATATDEDGTFDSNIISVAVTDVAPTLAISGAASVAEGGVYTLSLSSADPGDDTITSWTINWGDSVEVVSGNPASATHTYTDGSASYNVTATATNEDGTFSANSVAVTVDDVAPTLVINGAASVAEGSAYTLNLSSSDPGADAITSWTINWGDSVEVVSGNPASITHTYADGTASYNVTATATNEDGTFFANSVAVTVDDVAPTLAISGAANVAEGSAYTLNLSAADPGDDTITSWTINWGDSIELVSGNPASVTHTYADGAASYNVTATATNEDGTFSTNSVAVTVDDVAPTLAISGAANVAEGSVYTLSLSSSDPGDDTITSWTINWGDSVQVVSGNPASVTHTYADGAASYNIAATATNEDGTFSANSVAVTVDDVAPTLSISGAASVAEGSVYTLSLSSADPGDDTITSWTINWGDSVEVVSGNPASATHTYTDGSASYNVTATATNEDGTFSANSVAVTVDDVAPTLVINGAASVAEGSVYSLSLSATDPGSDTITSWTINWGDSVEVVSGDPASVTHTYADGAASYSITATATNEDGTFASNSVAVTVSNVAPTLVISGAASVNEGGAYTLNLSSSDPGADTITSWTINWGDAVQVVSGNPASVTHTYADGTVTHTVTATATDEDGTFSANSVSVTVNNVAPTANIGGPYMVGEGGSITLNGSATDPAGAADPLTFAWDLDNNGSFETSGASPVFSAAGIDGPATRTIHLQVTDGDGGVAVVTTTVSIVNVAPTADAGGPYLAFDDTPITLSGSGSDPAGATDPLTFTWDLDGDGIFGETGGAATRGNEVGANPTFNPTGLSTGAFTVSLRVSDGDGGVTTDTATVNVLTSGTLLIDGTLYIVGTNSCDIVLISKCNSTIYVCASFNDDNPMTFNSADVDHIEVRMRGNTDIVLTTSNVTQSMTIDGGSGNDLLTGGGGNNLLIGGSGHDVLYGAAGNDVLLGGTGNDDLLGGSGDDVLIGGDGDDCLDGGTGRDLMIGSQDNDRLKGGDGEDILIGGYTIHDNNLAALDAVMAVWTSSASFTTRVNTLKNAGGLLQGGVAVFDDDDGDEINGGSGRDLIFGDTYKWDGAIDQIALQSAQDVLVAVN